jgi:hypothetical protein
LTLKSFGREFEQVIRKEIMNQGIGYIKSGDKNIKVLYRIHKTYIAIKIRLSGSLGNLLEDESYYLNEHPDLIDRLQNGRVINL